MATSEAKRDEALKQGVQRYYADRIGEGTSCCGGGSSCPPVSISSLGYAATEVADLPAGAVGSSFGCGNPLALAGIGPGDVVADIGSGAGLDCLLAARRVGLSGSVIGIDMTPEMIERARDNARAAGITNVEFRLGDAESMPLEDVAVDWVISNCVINLAPDKGRVFREVARVLKPGGRVSISDIVFADDFPDIPAVLRADTTLVAACVGGAVRESEYLAAMTSAGLEGAKVVDRATYQREAIEAYLGEVAAKVGGGERLAGFMEALAAGAAGKVMSVRVSARKPRTDAPPVEVAPARLEDLPAVLELLNVVGLPVEGVEESVDGFVVARAGGRVVGCAGMEVHGASALLRSLAVAPGWRGDGIGRRLAETLLARARRLGLREAVTLTSTVQEWAARAGFEAVPREAPEEAVRSSWEFRAPRCASAVCMRLRLEG